MKRDGSSVTRLLVLGVATVALLGACIPFFGDGDNGEATPTPTPTITIIRPSPTAVAEPTAPPATETIYTVVAGDTLSGIADKFPGVSWEQIATANDLQSPYPLSIGQQLKIPPPPSQGPTPTPEGPSVVQTPEPKN